MIKALDCRRQGYAGAAHVVNFIDNHDHDRILWNIRQCGIFDEEATWRRAKLGASLLMTAPGIPMLCMGEEFGMSAPKLEPTIPVLLDWGLLQQAPNRELWQHYRKLIRLRKENPALSSNTFEVITEVEDRGIFAFRRWHAGEGTKANSIIVVVNLRDEVAEHIQVYAPNIEEGVWCELLSGQEIRVRNRHFQTDLGASEVKIFLHTPGR
jgi:1,4-alpha-glucan branching enzyme